MSSQAEQHGDAATPARAAPRHASALWEHVQSFFVAVLLALAVRTFVVQAFVIPSGSMLPTLRIGDYVLVAKFWYWIRPIQRGDILVFKFPKDESKDFIKRVVGLPGDTLEIRGRQVFINGQPLREPYAVFNNREPAALLAMERASVGPIVIPPRRYFMMGDNRDNSLDSRSWGLLKRSEVLGKAMVVYFSVRSDAIPPGWFGARALYALEHPAQIRWTRIGHLVG